MTWSELDNRVRIGKLKREPPSARELQGLLASARERLADADNTALAFASRFDLAYNASHALALLALRRAGFRCDARYLVFQPLPHTLGMSAGGRSGGGKACAGGHRPPAEIGRVGLMEHVWVRERPPTPPSAVSNA